MRVWTSLVGLPNMMPRSLVRMRMWISLAGPQCPTNGHEEVNGKVDVLTRSPCKEQKQESGVGGVHYEHHEQCREQHQPSAEAKDGETEEECQSPTTNHEEAAGKVTHNPSKELARMRVWTSVVGLSDMMPLTLIRMRRLLARSPTILPKSMSKKLGKQDVLTHNH